jgi:hypothetical protein
MVTLILVVGSVQVDDEVVEDWLDEADVHVMAVLVAAAPQEVKAGRAMRKTKSRKSSSAPRSPLIGVIEPCCLFPTCIFKGPNRISIFKIELLNQPNSNQGSETQFVPISNLKWETGNSGRLNLRSTRARG